MFILNRTTTMDDIYNHYISPTVNVNGSIEIKKTKHNPHRKHDKNDKNDNNDDYEEGDVTGYAMQHPIYVSKFSRSK